MIKIIAASIVAVAAAGGLFAMHSGYCPLSHWMSSSSSDQCTACDSTTPVALMDASATAPTTKSAAIDMKNTKCIVSGDDVTDKTLEYKGRLFHLCCPDCIADFHKNPEKYVKAFDADPARFGVKPEKKM